MFVTVYRTVRWRVHPHDHLVFQHYPDGEHGDAPNSRPPGFCSKFKTSWAEDYSLLSWADKGQWETVVTEDSQAVRERDWFRIGFEPIFVDFAKSGTWFVVISLAEVTTTVACVVVCGTSLRPRAGFQHI